MQRGYAMRSRHLSVTLRRSASLPLDAQTRTFSALRDTVTALRSPASRFAMRRSLVVMCTDLTQKG